MFSMDSNLGCRANCTLVRTVIVSHCNESVMTFGKKIRPFFVLVRVE